MLLTRYKTIERRPSQDLRDYQEQAVQAVIAGWEKRIPVSEGLTRPSSVLAAMATGGGKTTVFAEIIRRVCDPRTQRALFLADTQELIYQMTDRVYSQFAELLDEYTVLINGSTKTVPGLGIVMGEDDEESARLVVATRQSLYAERLQRVLAWGNFDYLIIDEAHTVSPDNTYHQIVKTLREANPELKIAGFTATPKRHDKKALAAVFDEIVYTWSIADGQDAGWLAPVVRVRHGTNIDLSSVRSYEGDYSVSELQVKLDEGEWVQHAVDAYYEHIHGKRRHCLAYFPFVDMSKAFTDQLAGRGVKVAHIDGQTPREQRMQTVHDYLQGKLAVISNVGVYTKGFDAPNTDSILQARPTRSEVLFTQIVGRGLRLFPPLKRDCLLVELAVNDVKAVMTGDLFGRRIVCPNPQCKADVWYGSKTCPVCGEDLTEAKRKDDELQALKPREQRSFKASLSTEVVELFERLYTSWYYDETTRTYSASAGFHRPSLLITSPTYDDVVPLLSRLDFGMGKYRAETDPFKKDIMRRQLGMLERMIERSTHYTLYEVPQDTYDPYSGRRSNTPVSRVKSSEDLADLMIYADSLIRAGHSLQSQHEIAKAARWRMSKASDKQIQFARKLGIKVDERKPPKSGELGDKITHALAWRKVKAWIQQDTLPPLNQKWK